MKIEQAIQLVEDFKNDKLFGYEMEDFLNSKQEGSVEMLRLDLQNEAMALSFNRTPEGIHSFKDKLIQILSKYS